MLSNGIHIGRRGGVQLTGGGGSPWWLAGGISAANVVAAYQPKGAASLAASYVNLANPGTNNLTAPAAPTWNAATGWTFAAARLEAALTVQQAWTVIVRAQATGNGLAGGYGRLWAARAGTYECIPRSAAPSAYFVNGGAITTANVTTNAVFCIANDTAYVNGVAVGTITLSALSAGNLFFGAQHTGGQTFSGTLQAAMIANSTLTAGQVATLSAAMAAL